MSHKIAHGSAVSALVHSQHIERCAAIGTVIQSKNYLLNTDNDIGSHVWYTGAEDGIVYHSSIDACNAPLPDVTEG